jgi:hypothetical protein
MFHTELLTLKTAVSTLTMTVIFPKTGILLQVHIIQQTLNGIGVFCQMALLVYNKPGDVHI